MRILPRRWLLNLVAQAACLGLLVGMTVQKRTYAKASDFEGFHADVKKQIDALPKGIANWMGVEEQIPPSAQKLLRPNATRCIRYYDTRLQYHDDYDRVAMMVFVQCKVSGDMVGHYPPNCYRSQGYEMVDEKDRDWQLDDQLITGREYTFRRLVDRQPTDWIVYNFLVVPRQGIFRDIMGVRSAAEDYQQRYLGAAQVQVVFAGPLTSASREERDEIFQTLLRPAADVIQTLKTGATLQAGASKP